jgi:hypothetical protein
MSRPMTIGLGFTFPAGYDVGPRVEIEADERAGIVSGGVLDKIIAGRDDGVAAVA